MKTLRLVKDKNRWLLKYDEKKQTVSVEGSGPRAEEIHKWLTTPKMVVDRETGQLTSVIPTQSWEYLKQAIEIDMYNDLGITALLDKVKESK